MESGKSYSGHRNCGEFKFVHQNHPLSRISQRAKAPMPVPIAPSPTPAHAALLTLTSFFSVFLSRTKLFFESSIKFSNLVLSSFKYLPSDLEQTCYLTDRCLPFALPVTSDLRLRLLSG